MRYWSLSRLIASRMIWVAFCGSQGSGTALAHRILYLRSWPTASSSVLRFGVFDDGTYFGICVFTKQTRKEKKTSCQVRGLSHYSSRCCKIENMLGIEAWKEKKRQIISFEDILISSEILLVSISDEWRRQLKRESFQITFQKFVKILMGEKNYFY